MALVLLVLLNGTLLEIGESRKDSILLVAAGGGGASRYINYYGNSESSQSGLAESSTTGGTTTGWTKVGGNSVMLKHAENATILKGGPGGDAIYGTGETTTNGIWSNNNRLEW